MELTKDELSGLKKIYHYLERDVLLFFDRAKDAFATCSLVKVNLMQLNFT